MPFNKYGVGLRVTHPSFLFLYQPAPPPILRNATVEQKNLEVRKYLNPAVSTSPESLGELLLFTFLLLKDGTQGKRDDRYRVEMARALKLVLSPYTSVWVQGV